MMTAMPITVEIPSVPVSWGELLDKVTILEIKRERITHPDAAANVARELALLGEVITRHRMDNAEARSLAAELKAVNLALWEIEDQIRVKEREGSFDDAFIALARSVYIKNDERAAIKRTINQRFACGLAEEKSYQAFPQVASC